MVNMIDVNKSNPILDTHVKNVMFPYVSLQKYASTVISEKMYLQVDSEGYQYQLIDKIIDHFTNGHAIHGDD